MPPVIKSIEQNFKKSKRMFTPDTKSNLIQEKFRLIINKISVHITSSKLLEFLKMFIENRSKAN